jgi:anti-sigma factor RsiW
VTTGNRAITEDTLHAYADGLLDAAGRAEVEAWLAEHPAELAEVAAWQRQNEALTTLFGPVANEPIPARLGPQLIAARRPPAAIGWPQLAAAAVVLVAIGGSIGWFGRDVVMPAEAASDILIDNAVAAHSLYVREKRHAVEVAASEEEHLESWLSNRIETPIAAPDLVAEGFTLIGGRLLPEGLYTESGPAAQLMYENAAAERLTVYITGALPDAATSYEFVTRGGVDAFYWANAAITCTVVGTLPDADMQTVARKVYQQLTWRPDTHFEYPRGT